MGGYETPMGFFSSGKEKTPKHHGTSGFISLILEKRIVYIIVDCREACQQMP